VSNTAATHWTKAHGTLLLAVSIEPTVIGKRIAEARNKRGWTQLQFALEANVSPSSVARWESGKLPPIRELIRIADLLRVDPDYLVEPFNEEPSAAAADVADLSLRLGELEAAVRAQEEATTKALKALTAGIRRLERRLNAVAPSAHA
jgi:transcriptional regulator with XRE-family HTH domain